MSEQCVKANIKRVESKKNYNRRFKRKENRIVKMRMCRNVINLNTIYDYVTSSTRPSTQPFC
jgi:hypothetical protein